MSRNGKPVWYVTTSSNPKDSLKTERKANSLLNGWFTTRDYKEAINKAKKVSLQCGCEMIVYCRSHGIVTDSEGVNYLTLYFIVNGLKVI